jgi:hypothetical protein
MCSSQLLEWALISKGSLVTGSGGTGGENHLQLGR